MNGKIASRPKRRRSEAIRILLRLTRSAITPAGCEKSRKARMRSVRALPMTAVADSPPVSRYAKSASPTVVTPLPSSETICAPNNSLKSRLRHKDLGVVVRADISSIGHLPCHTARDLLFILRLRGRGRAAFRAGVFVYDEPCAVPFFQHHRDGSGAV